MKAIIDAIILIPLAIIINIMADGPHIWNESILALLMLYGFLWFIWRIGLGITRLYSFKELLQPIIFMASIFVLMIIVTSVFPNYKINRQNDIGMTTEEMASNCPQALWSVTVHYEDGLTYGHSKAYTVEGNTETAQKKAKDIVDVFLELHPSYEYMSHDLGLYYLPKQFCKNNNYSLKWSETK